MENVTIASCTGNGMVLTLARSIDTNGDRMSKCTSYCVGVYFYQLAFVFVVSVLNRSNKCSCEPKPVSHFFLHICVRDPSLHIMEEERISDMENAQKESGESGGRPKRHFDADNPFNPTFGLEYERFCEEVLAWLRSRPETMRDIVSHKKRDWPSYVTDEPGRAAFRQRCKNYKLDLGRTGLVYTRKLCDGTCEYFHFHFLHFEHIPCTFMLPAHRRVPPFHAVIGATHMASNFKADLSTLNFTAHVIFDICDLL